MGYFMRYVVTDPNETTLDLIGTALKQASSLYSIQRSEGECGQLRFGNDVYGIIEINHFGERLFTSEVEELIEEVEEAESESKESVLGTLKSANYIIAVQVLWGPRKTEETHGKLDPLWNWLLANRRGLVQADGEGYYEGRKLILKIE